MENVPIDIHYNKLLDWLIDRRHCTLKWQQSAALIKEKVDAAMKEIPSDPSIQELMRGACVGYFRCLKVMEILKASGEGSKNIFGQYSSRKMKDWAEILQLYQNDNIHLAETAHFLVRNVNYEIPSLKRQISKCQQTQRDCTRKESEYMTNAGLFKDRYYYECKQMGVQGENIKSELLALVDELPVLFESIAEKTKTLEDSVAYYSEFVNFILSRGAISEKTEEVSKTGVTPMLLFVCKHGNATVYEWRTGKAPKDVRKEDITLDLDDKLDDVAEIDWGAVDTAEDTNDVIDFGDASDAIDFGDAEIELVDTTGILVEDNGAEIDFGIEAVGDKDTAIECEDAGQGKDENNGEVAKGSDALSILENTETRNLFIDELLEVESFLQQRLEELSSEGDILSAKQFQSAPTTIQIQSRDKVDAMLSKVSSILNDITSAKMQNLYRLKSSPHYVHRLADSLQQKLKTANNLLRQAKAIVERKENAQRLQIETEPKLELIIRETKELKQQIAGEISKKYKSRPVNIMGEINTI
ncbi:CDK5 regulatory subunit-associated protein 3-like [Rhopilema esculentum]|uniref:CDK5 regulatory subunit-associated protein 3-like n=1 Tax=Rhopilema esculentum TaxID=499914 RepID=UPI0031E21A4E|eukprot:gene14105-5093_t